MSRPFSRRRRILLSCFSCSPLWGSEPGVGWNWLKELAKHYDVVLLTHSFFKEHLEPELCARPIANLELHYCSAPAFGVHPHKQLNSRIFYIWWQWNLARRVKQLIRTQSFDLIHHLTWGTFRFPTFLGRLGVPLVMGPLGGGEVAPMKFYAGLPLKTRVREWVRAMSLHLARLDPLAMWGPRAASLVLCKTEETLRALPASLRARALIAPEIGSPEVDVSCRRPLSSDANRPFKLLYAGQITGWKGVAFLLHSMSLLVHAGHDVELDMAGSGPLHGYMEKEILRLGLDDRVHLLGMLPRPDLMKLYAQADLFVFPSLHDSSGNVVLESLSRGLPVVCLDLGGPKYYVTPECGTVVSTQGLSRTEVESGLAKAISELMKNPTRRAEMSAAALVQASLQTWESRVINAYELIEKTLSWK